MKRRAAVWFAIGAFVAGTAAAASAGTYSCTHGTKYGWTSKQVFVQEISGGRHYVQVVPYIGTNFTYGTPTCH